jgi:hypothetical protein
MLSSAVVLVQRRKSFLDMPLEAKMAKPKIFDC